MWFRMRNEVIQELQEKGYDVEWEFLILMLCEGS
jgi:hypothetical protein